jgi:hypothetical protein
MKHTCSECEKKRERCRAVVKHVDGHIEHVCPKCWKKFDYAGTGWYKQPKEL